MPRRATGRGRRRGGASDAARRSRALPVRAAILSLLSLLAATATALAPPFLAKYALDDAINPDNARAALPRRRRFLVAGLANWGMTLRADVPDGLGRASGCSPTCARSSSATSSGSRSASTSGTARA